MTRDMERNSILKDRQTVLGVIVPVYNGSKFLEQAVRSILSQPCRDLQVVIVNDGSTDDSLQIAEKIACTDKRVVVLNQENQGVSAARNHGIEYCLNSGAQYIAFLDADDVWANNFYTIDLAQQIAAEQYDAYHFTWYTANESMTRGRIFTADYNTVRDARSARFGSHFCSYLYRSELLRRYQIRFPVGMRVQEDCVFMYIFFTVASEVKSINKNFFFYRSNASSTLHAKHDACDWYVCYIIPAWKWAKSALERLKLLDADINDKDIDGCLTMQKTYLCEMIAASCNQGANIKHIVESISATDCTQLFRDDSGIWLDSASQDLWDSFWKNKSAVWMKHRLLGVIQSFASLLRNNPLFQYIRYKDSISTLIN